MSKYGRGKGAGRTPFPLIQLPCTVGKSMCTPAILTGTSSAVALSSTEATGGRMTNVVLLRRLARPSSALHQSDRSHFFVKTMTATLQWERAVTKVSCHLVPLHAPDQDRDREDQTESTAFTNACKQCCQQHGLHKAQMVCTRRSSMVSTRRSSKVCTRRSS